MQMPSIQGMDSCQKMPSFPESVQNMDIKFIGASGEQIDRMGDKASAKETMKEAGVPTIPGSEGLLKDVEEAKQIAAEMGYPVMIKATAGGGGKGMRAIWAAEEMEKNFESAVNEATAAFGNGGMYMEKLIEEPRHIEIQIIGDSLGEHVTCQNVIVLYREDTRN